MKRSPRLYQSEADHVRGLAIAKPLSELWGVELEDRQRDLSRIDFRFHQRGRTTHWVEVKHRHCYDIGRLPDVIMAKPKALVGVRLAKADNVPFVFALRFHEGIFWAEVWSPTRGICKFTERLAGRDDRPDDPTAFESCVCIHADQFQRLVFPDC